MICIFLGTPMQYYFWKDTNIARLLEASIENGWTEIIELSKWRITSFRKLQKRVFGKSLRIPLK